MGKVAGNGLEGQDGGPGVRHLQLALRRGQCRRPDTGNRTDEILGVRSKESVKRDLWV